MSTSLVTHEQAAYTDEQRRLITDVLCKGATETEIRLFMEVSSRCKLDPFRRQIHAVKRWDSAAKRETLTFQVGIDGLRAIAARTGEYAGNDDPVFEVDPRDSWHPVKATATVYRMVHGQRIPFTASVRWSEYVQTKRDGEVTSMWRQRPFGQLGKCAEAAALRKAFPEESGGLYTEEEFEAATPQPAPQQRPATVEVPATAEVAVKEIETASTFSAAFQDALASIEAASEAAELQQCREYVFALRDTNKAEFMAAGRALKARAEALGMVWSSNENAYVTP